MDAKDFKTMSLEDAFKELESTSSGLSDDEASQRISKYGYNEIAEKKQSPLLKLALYFWGPLAWMIEIAAVLSAILQHWLDLIVISSLLFTNAIIGFWQEGKADDAIELLKKRLAINAKVLRGGKWKTISARELVPGDVIRVRLGDIVPADVKLFQGDYLLVDESALTGESLPVEKHSLEMTYSGAVVKQGEMDALVISTAGNTFFAKTTKLVQQAKSTNHLQQAIVKISNYLIALALFLVVIVLLAAATRHQNFLLVLQFALVLLVASIPVAMPAVLSVTMAVGAMALAKKEAIVTKLESIEEMAGMDTLCVDKTGTITQNKISIAATKHFGGYSEGQVMGFAALASRKEDDDPIEAAIFNAAESGDASELMKRYNVIKYKPFDPVSKRTTAMCVDSKTESAVVIVKGAPQVIASLITSKTVSKDVSKDVEEFAADGYRTLAVAEGPSEKELQLIGLLALYDPPRGDSKKTITTAEAMGVDVKMITGDHIAIAREMSKEVGIGQRIIGSEQLQNPDISVDEVANADAFAEVFPEQKYDIVKMLQGKGHIVGMTGDGVNDAPALKEANAGIAVAAATDAARSAADIVLTASGISVIIDAIKQSRMIFERMNNYSIYRIAETIRVLLFLTLSIVLLNIYPLTVLMLVFLALLNDIPIMMIAYDNVRVHNGPVKWEMRNVLILATLLGVLGLVSSFSLLLLAVFVFKLNPDVLQTLMFLKMAVAGHMTIYLTRSGSKHFWEKPYPAGKLFFTTEITQLLATLFVISGILLPAVPWQFAALVWMWALTEFVLVDFIKVAAVRFLSNRRDSIAAAATAA